MRGRLFAANEDASFPHPSRVHFGVVPRPICDKTAAYDRENTASNVAMVSSGTVFRIGIAQIIRNNLQFWVDFISDILSKNYNRRVS